MELTRARLLHPPPSLAMLGYVVNLLPGTQGKNVRVVRVAPYPAVDQRQIAQLIIVRARSRKPPAGPDLSGASQTLRQRSSKAPLVGRTPTLRSILDKKIDIGLDSPSALLPWRASRRYSHSVDVLSLSAPVSVSVSGALARWDTDIPIAHRKMNCCVFLCRLGLEIKP